jgi:hypothetical protein
MHHFLKMLWFAAAFLFEPERVTSSGALQNLLPQPPPWRASAPRVRPGSPLRVRFNASVAAFFVPKSQNNHHSHLSADERALSIFAMDGPADTNVF